MPSLRSKRGSKTIFIRKPFPIDVAASTEAGYTVRFPNRRFAERTGTYYRFDIGLSYRVNKKRLTHTIMLDIQNVTNRANIANKYFNSFTGQIDADTQTGLFPNFNYRIEF